MIHSPTAFMNGTEIWLRYNERPEPVRQMGLAYTPSGLLNEPIQVFRDRVKQWQSSFRECVWQDQEAMQNWVDGLDPITYDEIKEGGYIKLDALAGRIEIVNEKYKPLVAVLLPSEESQEELLKAFLLALADKQDALSKFIITRRK